MRYPFGLMCVCALGMVALIGCGDTNVTVYCGPGGAGGGGDAGGTGGTVGTEGGACDLGICEGVDCDDVDPCTEDKCNGADGACSHRAACDDLNDCTTQMCDPSDGSCSTATPVADGTQCAGGTCQAGVCALTGSVLPCSEQGIRNAIAEGGDVSYTFDCDGPTTVTTETEIVIDNDVILDGEGNLTIDGNCDHRVFWVPEGATADLRGTTLTRGVSEEGSGVWNQGSVSMMNVTVSYNASDAPGGGIRNEGTLALTNSTVSSNNSGFVGGGIHNDNSGTMTATNSTVSGNSANAASGISNQGQLTLINSTLVGHTVNVCCAGGGLQPEGASLTITNTLIRGSCDDQLPPTLQLHGYNTESPGDTCGFDGEGDQASVPADQLRLGLLADNGGLTMTHALEPGSVAINQIPQAACVDAEGEPLTTDQRGEPRPETGGSICDVGAFEVQP